MPRRKPEPLFAPRCVGPEGNGCPRPGCPGDAEPVVVQHVDAPPVVRLLCNWCWIAERTAHPLPCSACGAIAPHVPQFSRWWYVHTASAVRDFCGDCLRPLPGLCSDCCFHGAPDLLPLHRLPPAEGDCVCPRPNDDDEPATIAEPARAIAERYAVNEDELDELDGLEPVDLVEHLAGTHDALTRAAEHSTGDDRAHHLAAAQQARDDLAQLVGPPEEEPAQLTLF